MTRELRRGPIAFIKHGNVVDEYFRTQDGGRPRYDGMRSYFEEILEISHGRRCLIISLGDGDARVVDGECELIAMRTFARARKRRALLRASAQLRIWIRLLRSRPSVVVVLDPGYYVLPVAAYAWLRDSRVIMAVPGELGGPAGFDGLRSQLVGAVANSRVTIGVLARSDSIARELMELGVPERRIVRYYPSYDAIKMKRHRHGQAPHGDVAFLGRLSAVKGVADLLPLAERLVQKNLGRIIIMGDGPLRAWIEKMLVEGDCAAAVDFRGHVLHADAMDTLAGCACLVVPSLSEGLCKAAVESHILGVPVVAYAVGGLRDVVESGVSGYLVEPGDRDALISRVEAVLKDSALRSALAAGAQAKGRLLMDQHPTFDEAVGSLIGWVRDDVSDKRGYSRGG